MTTILDKFEEIRKAELALERLIKEYNNMWESTFPKPDYGVTKTPTCPYCGLVMGGVMGYVCNREKCPTGLGGAFC